MRPGPTLQLNLNIRQLAPSATLLINELSNQLISQGKTVYKLGLGQSPFPVPDEVVEALRRHAPVKDYLPVEGLAELREAVAGYHRRVDQVPASADGVMVGPGSKELMFILQLAYYGDLVVPTPCWVSYRPQAIIADRPVSFIPTTFEQGWRLMPEALDRLCHADPDRPRIVLLNYPGNPDGNTYKSDELRQLARVARRYGVVLLSDEIYGPLHHRDQHVSVARFYPEGTIISAGLSKWCGAGGWRLGTFTFPQRLSRLRQAMTVVASETFTSTSAPIQHAAVTAFAGSEAMELYLAHSRRILAALGRRCARLLRQAGARLTDPVGAFYLFPDFSPLREALARRGITDGRELCRRCLEETGVAFLPGEDFGMPPASLTARLAYVDFDGHRALQASRQVRPDSPLGDAFLQENCGRVLQGIASLCQWLTAG